MYTWEIFENAACCVHLIPFFIHTFILNIQSYAVVYYIFNFNLYKYTRVYLFLSISYSRITLKIYGHVTIEKYVMILECEKFDEFSKLALTKYRCFCTC